MISESLLVSLEPYKAIIKVAVIVALAVAINKIMRYTLGSYLKRESARINVDPTAYNFLKNALTFIIFIGAAFNIVFVIPGFRQVAVTLFAGAGILAAIIGFASQTAFSNIINGIMIVAFKPFRIGDIIEVGTNENYKGTVEDITLRHTVIRNYELKRVVIPNTEISTQIIINRSMNEDAMIRFFEVTLPYSADLVKAMAIIEEEAVKHPLFVDIRTEEEIEEGKPKLDIFCRNLSSSGMMIRAYISAADSRKSFEYLMDMNKLIKLRFDQEGIEIALPYMNVVMHGQEKTSGMVLGNEGIEKTEVKGV